MRLGQQLADVAARLLLVSTNERIDAILARAQADIEAWITAR